MCSMASRQSDRFSSFLRVRIAGTSLRYPSTWSTMEPKVCCWTMTERRWNDYTNEPLGPMSSKSKKLEQSSDLSRHYREIGIKAVSSAAPRNAPSAERDTKRKIVQRRIPMNEATAARAARESINDTMATGAETVRGVQEGFTSAVKNVRDLNLRLIDMAQANTLAAFDFAREVAEAKGPSDLVEAWTTNATKQFDTLTKQAGEMTALCQRFASSTPELKGR
jgi:hypothetical protein